MSAAERHQLSDMLIAAEEVLQALVERAESEPVDAEEYALLLDAWPEVRQAFARARHALEAQSEAGAELDARLRDAGLLGMQLRMKLGIFWRVHRLFGGWPQDRRSRSSWRKATVRLLRVLNIILGSLAVVIPPVEAVSEFKDFLEIVLDLDG